MTAINKQGLTLIHVAATYGSNVSVVLAAVKNDGGALVYASDALKNDSFLCDWSTLTKNGHRNRRARQAFLAKYSDRNAKLQARVDLWLIQNDFTNHISAKRQKMTDC